MLIGLFSGSAASESILVRRHTFLGDLQGKGEIRQKKTALKWIELDLWIQPAAGCFMLFYIMISYLFDDPFGTDSAVCYMLRLHRNASTRGP